MPAPLHFYRQKTEYFGHQLLKKRKWLSQLAFLRLLVFVALIFCCYQWLNGWQQGWLWTAGGAMVLFIILVRISIAVKEKTDWLDKLHFINRNEWDILNGKPNHFDCGENHIEPGSYLADLDIFGRNSLFHLLNRTTTSHGSEMLAGDLKHPLHSVHTIRARQQAVEVLSEQPEICQATMASGLTGKEEKGNLQSIHNWLQVEPVFTGKQWITIIRILLPALNVSALIFYLATDNYIPLIAGIFAGWCITGFFARYILQQHVLVSRKTDILQQYAGILKHFSAANPGHADELKVLIQSIRTAWQSVRSLSKLSSLFDQRLNVLVYIFLNSFLLYDIQLVRSLEKWKIQHKPAFPEWINSVGKIEMFVSLAVYRFNHPQSIFPVPVEGKQRIEAAGVCHPLIPEQERIGNPVVGGDPEKMFLITGSNMSGKTTYLRTIGVTLVLAQSGAPVCAESFFFTPMSLLTSIRVNDSLQDHTSYFLAELKQLRLIVDKLETGAPALVLVDEILRGTNSEDKNHGSEAFIRKLLQYEVLCFFATHDLSLGVLEQELPEQVKNVCFESTLEEGKLVFDYRLREGLAKNRNATFLMQKMGII